MAKMFYSLDETTAKLNVPPEKLKELVDQGKLREFRDGAKVMYKVDQVDTLLRDLSGGTGTGSGVLNLTSSAGDSGIALAGDSSAGTKAPLAGGTKTPAAGTGAGMKPPPIKASPTSGPMRVFDEREVKPIDASAQTQITSPVYDAISPSGLDSVGSGSGLLDLTRESDNTSLGAELLDEIYPGEGSKAGQTGIGSASSGVFDHAAQTSAGAAAVATGAEPTGPMVSTYSPVVEAPDPTAGIFGGFALAAILAMGLTILISAAGVQGFEPGWLHTLASNLLLFSGLLVLVALLFGFVGFFAGRAASR
ncbi:MAG: helix-turn-helix domain-containing protein [Phycisphaerae bacterium]|nr:helix-turn-helix domain-containing protein [Phycisphaerae bacterium]